MMFGKVRREPLIPLVALAATLMLGYPAVAESYNAKVVDVSAGHIFELRHEGTRELVVLYGVESPSSKTLAGQAAKQFASEAILKKQVEVRVVRRLDEITLVEIRLEDRRNLGHVMLRKGLVRWDSYAAPGDEGLQELQQLAKESHRGMWYPSFDPAEGPIEPPDVQDDAPLHVASPVRSGGYRVLEGRVQTDEAGVKTLVLKGNGEKQIGFEAAVAQRRLDAHLNYLAELERRQSEIDRQKEAAARQAAEQAERNREEELLLETQRMLIENATRNDDEPGLRVWSRDTGWQ